MQISGFGISLVLTSVPAGRGMILRHPLRHQCPLKSAQVRRLRTQSKKALNAPGGKPLTWRRSNMKNRAIFALLLAVVLIVPAFAQQSPSQPATQSTPADQAAAPKADNATGKPALQPDTHEGFWGHLNPFARKKY